MTAVWEGADGAPNWIIQAATAPPEGNFGPAANLSAPSRDAQLPQVAASPDGTVTVVWQRSDGANTVIQAATRPPGGSFGAPVNLSPAGNDAINPQVAASPDGTVTVVWQRFNGIHDVVQASTRAPGGTFGPPTDLSALGGQAGSPQLAASPDGTVTVVWQRFDGANTIIQAATRPPGAGFGTPVDLSAPSQNATIPQVASAGDGSVAAVWSRFNGAVSIIQASVRTPGGSFAEPVDLSNPFLNADTPQISGAPDGSFSAVWSRFIGVQQVIQSSTRGPSGAFGEVTNLSQPGAILPQLAIAADGSATAVWQRDTGSIILIESLSTARPSPLLQVSRAGSGSGSVTSAPGGINCGTDCAENFPSFTEVTLTATPDPASASSPGSRFLGWSGGGCSGTEACTVTVLDAGEVTARFGKAQIGKVRVAGSSRVRSNAAVTYRVQIANTGDVAAAGVRVRLDGRGIRAGSRATGIPASSSRTLSILAKPRKTGRIKIRFRVTSANAGSRTVSKTITVTR